MYAHMKQNVEVLGTSEKLIKGKSYKVEPATNQPNYVEDKLYFVTSDTGFGVLCTLGEEFYLLDGIYYVLSEPSNMKRKDYHIALTKPGMYGYAGEETTLIVEMSVGIDYLSPQVYHYLGVYCTNKTVLTSRKKELLKAVNESGASFVPEGGFKKVEVVIC